MKIQERNNAQKSDIPYFAPVFAMVVTLPVPILYPIKNNPGPIALKPMSTFLVMDVLAILSFYHCYI